MAVPVVVTEFSDRDMHNQAEACTNREMEFMDAYEATVNWIRENWLFGTPIDELCPGIVERIPQCKDVRYKTFLNRSLHYKILYLAVVNFQHARLIRVVSKNDNIEEKLRVAFGNTQYL